MNYRDSTYPTEVQVKLVEMGFHWDESNSEWLRESGHRHDQDWVIFKDLFDNHYVLRKCWNRDADERHEHFTTFQELVDWIT